MNKKITVIGGGPGGYVAAIRAVQLGAEVQLVEKEYLGGTCLNIGCIPTKAILESAHAFHEAGHSIEMGVLAEPKLDWGKVQDYRKAVINQLVGGVAGLLKANKVKVINGAASFKDTKTLQVNDASGKISEIQSDYYIIATGSSNIVPVIPGIDSECCINSTQALSLEHCPKSMIIVGGGVIGIEFAAAYNNFGTEVTVVEMAPTILPNVDTEMAKLMEKDMKKKGIHLKTSTKVCSLEGIAGHGICNVELNGKPEKLEAEVILVCIGRKANIEGMNLDKIGVKTERAILADNKLQTSVKNIYAIGDCNGKMMLAHAASEQAMIAVENIMGKEVAYRGDICPSGVYFEPEVASVGRTEEQLKEAGVAYKKSVFPLMANGRSLIHRCDSGAVKILAGEKYNEILGVHIYGPQATELIHEAALAMSLEATVDEIIEMIHAHPTVSEAMREAALGIEKRMIHMLNR